MLTLTLRCHPSHPPLLTSLTSFTASTAESIHSASRLVAALLFAALPPHLPPHFLPPLLPLALALCQDTSSDVRRTMCTALPPLTSTLPPTSMPLLSTELCELLRDEEVKVQQAALLSLPPPLLPSVLPILRQYFAHPPHALHLTLARIYGHLLTSLPPSPPSPPLPPDIHRLLRDFYKQSSAAPDPAIRYWCVWNLPALWTVVGGGVMEGAWLGGVMQGFAHDADREVRMTLARSLGVVVPLVMGVGGGGGGRVVKELLLTLLRDGEAAVRDLVVTSLPSLLSLPIPTAATPPPPTPFDTPALTEVFRGLLALDGSGMAYRTKVDWLTSLFALRAAFATPELAYMYYDRLSPIVFSTLHASPPVPLLSLLFLLLNHFLSSLPSSQRRHDLLQRLLRECGPTSRSCYDRLMFLSLVESWLTLFSRRWMRRHVLAVLVKMVTSEGVREVRVRALDVMGKVDRARLLDAKDKEAWGRVVMAMCGDADRYVQERAKEWVKRRAGKGGVGGEVVGGDEGEEERMDREKEEREERLQRDEDEALELLMRKEQVRERAALLNGGGASSQAVMLLMMKQKKEREKEVKEKEREKRAAAATEEEKAPGGGAAAAHGLTLPAGRGVGTGSGGVPVLSPIAGKDRKLPLRVGLAAGVAKGKPSGAAAEAEAEEEKKDKGKGRSGYLPGLSTSTLSASSPSTPSALFRSPSSSSTPSSLKRLPSTSSPTPTLPPASPSVTPHPRRLPPSNSLSASPSSLPSPSSAGLVIPALNGSPRVAKVPPVAGKGKAAAGATAASPVSFGLTGSGLLRAKMSGTAGV